MRTKQDGFTLIELMIVALIIMILAAIGIPNFIRIQDRAKEACVKSNMHTIQLAMEDFAVQTDGWYPDTGASTTPGGDTVADLCPDGNYPENPFTYAPTAVVWDGDPAASGLIGINPANTTTYIIKGYGKSVLLSLQLSPGF
jgi:prepilin-type N-terminal cleavage/methylation domain-containing protein